MENLKAFEFKKRFFVSLMSWDDTLPIPIRNSVEFPPDLECCCKNCKPAITYDHLHCWAWHYCDVCHKKIWFNLQTCTLYAWRKSKQVICFNCRIPCYKLGMTAGQIHRHFREKKQG